MQKLKMLLLSAVFALSATLTLPVLAAETQNYTQNHTCPSGGGPNPEPLEVGLRFTIVGSSTAVTVRWYDLNNNLHTYNAFTSQGIHSLHTLNSGVRVQPGGGPAGPGGWSAQVQVSGSGVVQGGISAYCADNTEGQIYETVIL